MPCKSHSNHCKGMIGTKDSMEITRPKNPLQGIGGPVTRLRTKNIKQVLQGLLKDLQEEKVHWVKTYTASRMVSYLRAKQAVQEATRATSRAVDSAATSIRIVITGDKGSEPNMRP